MKPILKLIIAIMLILCLADMPYGFYEMDLGSYLLD